MDENISSENISSENISSENISSENISSENISSENISSIEKMMFEYLDRYKFLFYPEQWNRLFLDFSKNDIFTLVFVYRKKEVNVTEIADYLKVPLNTVTGVISRLEKKALLIRERSITDKRVVTVRLSEAGSQLLRDELRRLTGYYFQIMEVISPDEKALFFRVIEKILQIISADFRGKTGNNPPARPIKRITIE